MLTIPEVRIRTKLSEDHCAAMAGRVALPGDYCWLVNPDGDACRILRPDGKPLAVYLPRVLKTFSEDDEIYKILGMLRSHLTDNRGLASGTIRLARGQQNRDYAGRVPSAVIGAMDRGTSIYKYCRLTAWNAEHLAEFDALTPMLQEIAHQLAEAVPDRYAAQAAEAARTAPEWVVPGTPFTTMTVNNSYPTGYHKDKGDLDAGFSTICCVRRGMYTGGQLVFPQYKVAVDLHDGDLLCMDAHDWHGNVPMTCACGSILAHGGCQACDAERISMVAYYRTRMAQCGTAEEERAEASRLADKLSRTDEEILATVRAAMAAGKLTTLTPGKIAAVAGVGGPKSCRLLLALADEGHHVDEKTLAAARLGAVRYSARRDVPAI